MTTVPARLESIDADRPALAARAAILAYGLACYATFFGTFLYAFGFIGNILVPKGIDSARAGPLWLALVIDLHLLVVFAIQHSVMARPAFKRWWTRIVPPAAERSTYVLFSSVALVLLYWLWQPIGGVVWDVPHPVGRGLLYALFGSGRLIMLLATFQINHFDLFGLRQAWTFFRGRPYRPLAFKTPAMYRVVRHPLYVGWMIAFWGTPTMTAAHLVFAIATTVYMLVAVQFEERDLTRAHPEYAGYRRRVRMLLPIRRRVAAD